MIFYYTSTGNSQWVAERLSHYLDETLLSINSIAKNDFTASDYEFQEGERLIFVFPVHSWNVPATVVDFIEEFTFEGKPSSVYAVCTCGDDCGLTDKKMAKLMDQKGLKLNACFSVQMPNNYVLFPGFNIDPVDVQDKKIHAAVDRVKQLADDIARGETNQVGRYTPGSMAWAKTTLIYPFFAHVQCGHTPFYATEACVGCGMCAQVCPVNNIRLMSDGRPQWRNHCTQCAACFHHCPKNAVQYGSLTKNKGQYINTHVKFDD